MSRRRKFAAGFAQSPFAAKIHVDGPLSPRARIEARQNEQRREHDDAKQAHHDLMQLILATPIPFHRHCPAKRFGKWAKPCNAEMAVVYVGDRFQWVCPTGKHVSIPIQKAKLVAWVRQASAKRD